MHQYPQHASGPPQHPSSLALNSEGYSRHHPPPQTHTSNNNNAGAYLQPPLISPPVQQNNSKLASSPTAAFGGWNGAPLTIASSSYQRDQQGLSALSSRLHRITFVEACIFQPPELPSPSALIRSGGAAAVPQTATLASSSQLTQTAAPVQPPRPLAPLLASGERSPTSTGGTQYYQEWASKHMRHLCSRFEKPSQQQLLMNVERKSKYPFIILCTPDSTDATKVGSSSSLPPPNQPHSQQSRLHAPQPQRMYQNQISQHSSSAYSMDDEEDEEELSNNWITQKQRDSINSHYLPPPPPPLLMPHIWPEIRYIDGLYTVCASIIRPGSGIPDDEDDQLFMGMEEDGNMYQQHNSHHGQPSSSNHRVHFQHQQSHSSSGSDHVRPRPTGYVVSGFATFPGEDSERLEKSWLLWTGTYSGVLPDSIGTHSASPPTRFELNSWLLLNKASNSTCA